MPLEPGNVDGGADPAQDLLHGEEACVIAEDLVYRVMRGGRLLDQGSRLAFVVESAPELLTNSAGDRRRESIADLPVIRGLAASEFPPVLTTVPALQPGDHLASELGQQRLRTSPGTGRCRLSRKRRRDACGAFLGTQPGHRPGAPDPRGHRRPGRIGGAAGPRCCRRPRPAAHRAARGRRADPVAAPAPSPGRPATDPGRGAPRPDATALGAAALATGHRRGGQPGP